MGDRARDKVGSEGVGGAAHELGEHGDGTATVLGVHVAQHVDGLVHAQQTRLWRDLPQPVAHYPLLSAQHSLVSTSHVPQKERKKRQTIKNKKHKKEKKKRNCEIQISKKKRKEGKKKRQKQFVHHTKAPVRGQGVGATIQHAAVNKRKRLRT